MDMIWEQKNIPVNQKKGGQKGKSLTFFMSAVIVVMLAGSLLLFNRSKLSAPPSLHSKYAVLIDAENGRTMLQKNSKEKIYPASLTKIMTAILAIEYTKNLEETIEIPSDIYAKLYEENASMAGFEPGEKARLKDLLYGVMLPSGAECCETFAHKISGSVNAFVDKMNEKAAQLGMKDTHFCNTTGLHNAEHYTTVEDMAILLQYSLQNEIFRQVFTSRRHSTMTSEVHPDGFTFYSTMFENLGDAEVTGGKILGGKTGYTKNAGLCLASLAEINGKEYILVTAKAKGSHETKPYHIEDARKIYEWLGKNNA